jgi:hypothetical protein
MTPSQPEYTKTPPQTGGAITFRLKNRRKQRVILYKKHLTE